MPRASAQQREAQKISTPLPGGGYAASVGDVPSQATWKEHASSLLTSMPGDRKRRKKTLESVISALLRKREEFRREKKTGAGVTTEAIEFYQFVMDINTTWKGTHKHHHHHHHHNNNNSNNKQQQSKNNQEKERKKRKKLKKKRGVGRPRKKPRLEESEEDNEEDESEEDEEEDNKESGSEGGSVPDTDTESDVSSMDEEEFLRQHNDLCEVCNTGGELLCCATCNLVFHMKCARPSLKVMPPDEWSCAHCDATGVTGFKREARRRKRAAQAVRQMDKMRIEFVRQQQHNPPEPIVETISITVKIKGSFEDISFTPPPSLSSRSDGTITPPPVDGTTKHKLENDKKSSDLNNNNNTEGSSSQGSTLAARKNSEDAIIIGHSGTNKREVDQIVDSLSPLNFLSPRSRRSRRQPTLYDPQFGAASDWQSDGKNEWRYLSKEETERGLQAIIPKKKVTIVSTPTAVKKEEAVVAVEEAPPPKKAPMRMSPEQKAAIQKLITKPIQPGRVSRYVTVQCKFCMDDETLEVCCFCACRVCFSKYEKEKTILCDMCDAEYHMFCLNPPLASIPNDDWYCPTCQDLIAKAQKQDLDGTTTSTKRISTSNKRYQSSSSSSNKSNHKKQTSKKEKETPPTELDPSVTTTTTTTTNNNNPVEPVKASKKKTALSEPSSPVVTSSQPTTTTPTIANNHHPVVVHEATPSTPAVPPKRGRGRPRKYPRPPDKLPNAPKGKPGRKPKSATTTTIPTTNTMEPPKTMTTTTTTSTATLDSTNTNNYNTPLQKQRDNHSEHPVLIQSHNTSSSSGGGGDCSGGMSTAAAQEEIGKIHIKSQGEDVRKVVEGQFDDASSSSCGSKPEPELLNSPSQQQPMFDSSGGLVSSSRSRSGRTVKRNAFHDEIGEGEQHLKARDDRKTAILVPPDPPQPMVVLHPPSTTTTTTPTTATTTAIANPPVTLTTNHNTTAVKEPIATAPIPQTNNSTTPIEPFSKPKSDIHTTTTTTTNNNSSHSGSLPSSSNWKETTSTEPNVNAVSHPSQQPLLPSSSSKKPSSSIESQKSQSSSLMNLIPPTAVKVTTKLHNPVTVSSSSSSPPPPPTTAPKEPLVRVPRRKPGARECMQISRRFGVNVIPQKYMDIMMDYCSRGKVEHLIRMRERLDDHSKFLESQIAGLEAAVAEKGELDIVVPPFDAK